MLSRHEKRSERREKAGLFRLATENVRDGDGKADLSIVRRLDIQSSGVLQYLTEARNVFGFDVKDHERGRDAAADIGRF